MIPLPGAIAEALDRGATIVTGNQRAARMLTYAFDQRNRNRGITEWHPAKVFAWETFAAALWRGLLVDGHEVRLLMNRTQEHAVWQQILVADAELRSLRSHDALAEMAADAWHSLCSYNGQHQLRGTASSTDTLAFQRWSVEFQRRCRDNRLLSHAELEASLCDHAHQGTLRLDTSDMVLTGFDRMTSSQSSLVDAMRAAGCAIEEVQPSESTEQRLLVSAEDEREEIATAARWIRGFREAHPVGRVAVIAPALESRRAEIDRVFRDVLAPELQSIETPQSACPFEFSLGVPLAQVPIVKTALNLLRWIVEPLPVEQVSALLLSPSFAMSEGERGARAEFDAFEVRRATRLRPEVFLEWLSRVAARSQHKERLGLLPAVLRDMLQYASKLANSAVQRSHAEWAETMREILLTAHWGITTASSHEFQAQQKWDDALDELATLDFDGSRVDFRSALEALSRIAQQTTFAPEAHHAPVQVMGAFEAAGSTFDAVWFLGAGDLSWPVAARRNPLLSWQLQRALEMPGTDVERDSDDAQQTTGRIAASARTAIFSFAKKIEEGKQQPSSATAHLGLTQVNIQSLTGPGLERQIVALEAFEDSQAVPSLPDSTIQGGANVLKLQAACSFRAFAEARLFSTEPEISEAGLNAQQSGILVHRVLEFFWNEAKSQSALLAMGASARLDVLNRAIDHGLEKFAALSASSWDAAYLQMQRGRLRRLLGSWIELEMRRRPFEVKLSEQSADDVRIGPLRLNVRVDRVDLVEGGAMLIDYKTGHVSPNDWLSERPNEPQLPLYATLFDPGQLQSVAFGVVRAGDDLDLTGYCASPGLLPHCSRMKAESLEAQIDEWRYVLQTLAEEFYEGSARVDPKQYPKTCEHCPQRILCRLDPTQLEESEPSSAAEVSRG